MVEACNGGQRPRDQSTDFCDEPTAEQAEACDGCDEPCVPCDEQARGRAQTV